MNALTGNSISASSVLAAFAGIFEMAGICAASVLNQSLSLILEMLIDA